VRGGEFKLPRVKDKQGNGDEREGGEGGKKRKTAAGEKKLRQMWSGRVRLFWLSITRSEDIDSKLIC